MSEMRIGKVTAFEWATLMYADEPCRICGRLITEDDLKEAVFAGYSEDNDGRCAHGRCWEGYLKISAESKL